jgi:SAM-dependent methyltransferase
MPSSDAIKPPARWVIRRLPGRRVRWGTFRRRRPFSDCYGWDRGLPVDRFYIERFLAQHAACIRGDVLEVRDAEYTRRFGRERVRRAHVVDIDPGNPAATLIADLCRPGSLPVRSYDCIVLTQTYHLLGDERSALGNLWGALRPGGSLLLTAPCVSRVDREIGDTDLWRFTPRGLERRLHDHCPGGEVVVEGHGNVQAGVAFWTGVAAEEMRAGELMRDDPYFPIVACAVITKESE